MVSWSFFFEFSTSPKLGEDEAILTNIVQRGLNQVDKLGDLCWHWAEDLTFHQSLKCAQSLHIYRVLDRLFYFFQKLNNVIEGLLSGNEGKNVVELSYELFVGCFHVSDGLNSSINEWAKDLLVNFDWILELSQDGRGAWFSHTHPWWSWLMTLSSPTSYTGYILFMCLHGYALVLQIYNLHIFCSPQNLTFITRGCGCTGITVGIRIYSQVPQKQWHQWVLVVRAIFTGGNTRS